LETIKQTNLGQLGGGTTKDEGRTTWGHQQLLSRRANKSFVFCPLRLPGSPARVGQPFWVSVREFQQLDCQKYICLGYATEISPKHVMTISAGLTPPSIPENLLLYIPCILHIYPCPRGVGKLKLGCSLKPSGVCCVPFSFCGVDETLMTLRTHSRGKRQQGPCVQLRFLPLNFSAQFHFEANEDKAG